MRLGTLINGKNLMDALEGDQIKHINNRQTEYYSLYCIFTDYYKLVCEWKIN